MTYIVIPSYIVTAEHNKLAEKCIESFRNTSIAKIILVDDGSPYKHNLKNQVDIYLENESNQGFGPTCNKGFQWIFDNVETNPYIVCANNDIEVYNGWEKALREPFQTLQGVAVTGITSRRVKIDMGTHIRTMSEDRITVGGKYKQYMQQGALWMSTKEILQEVGTFDERYTGGGMEDVDLFIRMRDTFGKRIVMSGKSVFYHVEGATRFKTNKGLEQLFREKDRENEQKFLEKWGYDYRTTPDVWREDEVYER